MTDPTIHLIIPTPAGQPCTRCDGDGQLPGDEYGCTHCHGTTVEPVNSGERADAVDQQNLDVPPHDCMDNAVLYQSDGALGHGWECGLCGAFLQAG